MCIDVEVTARFDFKIEHTVARNLVEHVIEKGHLRREPGAATSVEVQYHGDLRFQRIAGHLRITLDHIGPVHATIAMEWMRL
jgi:hypothetical protein